MAVSELGALLLKKLPVLGPLIIAAALGAVGAWKSRAVFDGGQSLQARVEHLDSVTVRRDEFSAALDNLRQDLQKVSTRQDSTNDLLRRVICQKQTIILCQRSDR